MNSKRKCSKCKTEIFNNLAILCSTCSDTDKTCEICLKKVQNSTALKNGFMGCSACKKS